MPFTRKIISVLSLFIIVSSEISAQEYYSGWEYGGGVGMGHYFGDLNPNWGLKEPRVAASLVIKKNFNPYISLSGTITYTKIGYKDSYAKNEFQQMRNLQFKSNIIEASVISEFNFFWFETGKSDKKYTPFIALGVGAFYYEPLAYYSGKSYKLRELGTEGQKRSEYADRRYNNLGISFPVGAGFKWWIKPGWNLSFAILNRFTLNDYLDDVSKTYVGIENFQNNSMAARELQDRSILTNGDKIGYNGKKRGDTSTKDQFFTAQLTLTIQLRTYKCPNTESGLWKTSDVAY